MRQHYAVVHYSGLEAPDDEAEDQDPIARKWIGYASNPAEARNMWAAEHCDHRFSDEPKDWTADQVGLEHLMIFRLPASPFDLLGLLSLWWRKGEPVAYVPSN